MSSTSKPGRKFTFGDAEIDLVPMIDCIFLLLLFFMLCGRITMDQRTEQITVPPTKTATKLKEPQGWTRVIVNVYGTTQEGNNGKTPRNSIQLDKKVWNASGADNFEGYIGLRAGMDRVYDAAAKYDDPKKSGMKLPKVIVEVRADGDTEYRVVQEIQQVLSDTIDPSNGMQARKNAPVSSLRPFVNIDFTARRPDDK
jgi:biopolymer transport protein ExbD